MLWKGPIRQPHCSQKDPQLGDRTVFEPRTAMPYAIQAHSLIANVFGMKVLSVLLPSFVNSLVLPTVRVSLAVFMDNMMASCRVVYFNQCCGYASRWCRSGFDWSAWHPDHPDPNFHIDVDPDADLDPSFQIKDQILEKVLKKGLYSIDFDLSSNWSAGSGSGSSWSIWCGSGCGSRLPKWCGSIRIRIHNTDFNHSFEKPVRIVGKIFESSVSLVRMMSSHSCSPHLKRRKCSPPPSIFLTISFR